MDGVRVLQTPVSPEQRRPEDQQGHGHCEEKLKIICGNWAEVEMTADLTAFKWHVSVSTVAGLKGGTYSSAPQCRERWAAMRGLLLAQMPALGLRRAEKNVVF